MGDTFKLILTPWFKAERLVLPEEDQDRVNRKLRDFRQKGWAAATSDGSVKNLRDGIYELRVLGHGAAFRILFFLMPGESPRVVVLTTCAAKETMKKRKRMDAQIERAKARRAEWLEQQKKRGDDGRR